MWWWQLKNINVAFKNPFYKITKIKIVMKYSIRCSQKKIMKKPNHLFYLNPLS